jgi:hypothetical protein
MLTSRRRITGRRGRTLLTIFSSPKPSSDHIDLIQRNAIRSWLELRPAVEVMLIGDEAGMDELETEFRIPVLREVERNEQGTPRLDSIFSVAREHATHPILCYVNTDVIMLNGIHSVIDTVRSRFENFLIVGQRWDLDVQEHVEGSFHSLRKRLSKEGRLHAAAGSDYFVFPRMGFADIPPFALGRAGWDNWMIFAARAKRIPLIDATGAITAIHQTHDYGHLPGGRSHYRLPESENNLRLAGGREMMFTSRDATWRWRNGLLTRHRFPGGVTRSVESALIARVGSGRIARLIRMVFHPRELLIYVKSVWRVAAL